MSRSVFPGVTVYHSELTTQLTRSRVKRNGVSAASAAVVPEKDAFSTSICFWIIASIRAFSSDVRGVSEMEWKTVGIVTVPWPR